MNNSLSFIDIKKRSVFVDKMLINEPSELQRWQQKLRGVPDCKITKEMVLPLLIRLSFGNLVVTFQAKMFKQSWIICRPATIGDKTATLESKKYKLHTLVVKYF